MTTSKSMVGVALGIAVCAIVVTDIAGVRSRVAKLITETDCQGFHAGKDCVDVLLVRGNAIIAEVESPGPPRREPYLTVGDNMRCRGGCKGLKALSPLPKNIGENCVRKVDGDRWTVTLTEKGVCWLSSLEFENQEEFRNKLLQISYQFEAEPTQKIKPIFRSTQSRWIVEVLPNAWSKYNKPFQTKVRFEDLVYVNGKFHHQGKTFPHLEISNERCVHHGHGIWPGGTGSRITVLRGSHIAELITHPQLFGQTIRITDQLQDAKKLTHLVKAPDNDESWFVGLEGLELNQPYTLKVDLSSPDLERIDIPVMVASKLDFSIVKASFPGCEGFRNSTFKKLCLGAL